MSIKLGSSVFDKPFERSETDVPYIRTLYDLLKQALTEKSFGNVLWAIAISLLWDG